MFIQVAFLFVVVFLTQIEGLPVDTDVPEVFIYVSIFMSIGSIFGAKMVVKNQLVRIKTISEPQRVKSSYQSTFIVGLAILEAASLFSIVTYMLTQDKLVLGIILILLMIQGSQKPGSTKFMADLELSQQEYDNYQ